jgi:glutamyl-tRNA reductase
MNPFKIDTQNENNNLNSLTAQQLLQIIEDMQQKHDNQLSQLQNIIEEQQKQLFNVQQSNEFYKNMIIEC